MMRQWFDVSDASVCVNRWWEYVVFTYSDCIAISTSWYFMYKKQEQKGIFIDIPYGNGCKVCVTVRVIGPLPCCPCLYASTNGSACAAAVWNGITCRLCWSLVNCLRFAEPHQPALDQQNDHHTKRKRSQNRPKMVPKSLQAGRPRRLGGRSHTDRQAKKEGRVAVPQFEAQKPSKWLAKWSQNRSQNGINSML